MSKNKKLFIVGIIIVVGMVAIYIIIKRMPYESRYFEKLGVNKYRYLYRDMIEDFGKFNEVSTLPSGAVCLTYNDFQMIYGSTDDDALLLGITIIGKKYRFGWRSIGVGSTREEVLRAYSNVPPCPDPGVFAYVDGGIFVEFHFDDDGIVDEIEFYTYP